MARISASLVATFACVGAVFAGGSVVACSASQEGASAPRADTSSTTTTTTTTTTGTTTPPEQELESAYGAPVATGTYVWIANAASGRVAFINAATLAVEVVEAGHAPTYLAAVPDPVDDVAIVLNVLSRDATLLRASGSGLSTRALSVPTSGNAWAVSPTGRFATAWTDARRIASPDPIDGYQDISVLDLTVGQERTTELAVGYRPVALGYAADSSRLFAVTADGVTVVDLSGPAPLVVDNVALSDDPFEDTQSRDVAITPDGAYALVRRDGDPTVRVVTLATGVRSDVVLPGPVTDLDLAADGSVAVAVVRDTSEVALLRLPDVAEDPLFFTLFSVADTTIGSVSLAGASTLALLYTNAVPSPVLTVFDSAALVPEPRPIVLKAPVEAVFPTPDGAHAVVLHHELAGVSSYPAALSVVPVAALLPAKIFGLDAPVVSVAVSPAGTHALVATSDALSHTYQMVVARMPSLDLDAFPLASEPIAAGIVLGADQGYVAQRHPDGRITFVDFGTGQLRTVTGFELAAQVVDGSAP
ncbi:MAG: hypothetical protein HY908_36455 [Myxococcales bacterium]|nr:hypothetical protein [Myxococcales bacterium]